MQTLKEYLAIIIIAAIALFIEINFLHPEKYKSFRIIDYYDEEVEMAVQSLMAAMEPMIIIVLAVVVGGLVAAVMAPMLTMYQALDTI